MKEKPISYFSLYFQSLEYKYLNDKFLTLQR